MGLFSKKNKQESRLVEYVNVPTLYPMGSVTFAIACSHCKNIGSSKCSDCKREIKSGFELKFPMHSDRNLCVCCGAEIPEGSHVCSTCLKKGKDFTV